ncbi:efflux RND transporter periplasmic adaptor subunit [Sphingomonas sp.]|uniref:efflux RND transporter periplasmic adaptor subunit n=1 Tax=Sphingomonas sp. TaxID=28214 RepID=UPI003B005C22
MNLEQGGWRGEPVADISDGTRRRRRRMVLIAGGLLILAALIGVLLARRGKADSAVAVPVVPAVTVVVPGRTAVADIITATGVLSAKRDMPVGVAGEGGMVSRVLVDAGARVRPGQTLATIDPAVQAAQTSQVRAQIAAAQADAKLAQSQLDRAQALVGRGFISKADIDTRTATRDAARARVELAQAQYREQIARLGRLDIRSPAGGVVLARAVEPGQIVSSGSPALFRIAMDGQVEVRARLAEQDLAHVRVGMPVTVTPVGSDQSFTGRVWQISPIIDPTTRQGEARVALPFSPALRPGGFASARFSSDNADKPVLPESAVMSDQHGTNYVYVVGRDDRVARRDVRVGDVSDAGIAVLSGLDGNERVVFSAGAFLNPGDKIAPHLRARG